MLPVSWHIVRMENMAYDFSIKQGGVIELRHEFALHINFIASKATNARKVIRLEV